MAIFLLLFSVPCRGTGLYNELFSALFEKYIYLHIVANTSQYCNNNCLLLSISTIALIDSQLSRAKLYQPLPICCDNNQSSSQIGVALIHQNKTLQNIPRLHEQSTIFLCSYNSNTYMDKGRFDKNCHTHDNTDNQLQGHAQNLHVA